MLQRNACQRLWILLLLLLLLLLLFILLLLFLLRNRVHIQVLKKSRKILGNLILSPSKK